MNGIELKLRYNAPVFNGRCKSNLWPIFSKINHKHQLSCNRGISLQVLRTENGNKAVFIFRVNTEMQQRKRNFTEKSAQIEPADWRM